MLKPTHIQLKTFNNEVFDIEVESDEKKSSFNNIVREFTKRITIRSPINVVRVECVGMIDTGYEIKYRVIISYHSIRSHEFELKQSTFERLVMLACEKDGITNIEKYKQLLASIEMGLIDKKLCEHNMHLQHAQHEVDRIQNDIESLIEYRATRTQQ